MKDEKGLTQRRKDAKGQGRKGAGARAGSEVRGAGKGNRSAFIHCRFIAIPFSPFHSPFSIFHFQSPVSSLQSLVPATLFQHP